MACISWNACWVAEFWSVLRNPLRNTQKNMPWYHAYVWTVSFVTSVLVYALKWHSNSQNHTCWVRGDITNFPVFEAFLVSYLVLAAASLVSAVHSGRLSGTTFSHDLRRTLCARHTIYVLCFLVLWTWPTVHWFVDPEEDKKWLTIVDAVTVSGQGFVLSIVRLSERGASTFMRSMLTSIVCCEGSGRPRYNLILDRGVDFDHGRGGHELGQHMAAAASVRPYEMGPLKSDAIEMEGEEEEEEDDDKFWGGRSRGLASHIALGSSQPSGNDLREPLLRSDMPAQKKRASPAAMSASGLHVPVTTYGSVNETPVVGPSQWKRHRSVSGERLEGGVLHPRGIVAPSAAQGGLRGRAGTSPKAAFSAAVSSGDPNVIPEQAKAQEGVCTSTGAPAPPLRIRSPHVSNGLDKDSEGRDSAGMAGPPDHAESPDLGHNRTLGALGRSGRSLGGSSPALNRLVELKRDARGARRRSSLGGQSEPGAFRDLTSDESEGGRSVGHFDMPSSAWNDSPTPMDSTFGSLPPATRLLRRPSTNAAPLESSSAPWDVGAGLRMELGMCLPSGLCQSILQSGLEFGEARRAPSDDDDASAAVGGGGGARFEGTRMCSHTLPTDLPAVLRQHSVEKQHGGRSESRVSAGRGSQSSYVVRAPQKPSQWKSLHAILRRDSTVHRSFMLLTGFSNPTVQAALTRALDAAQFGDDEFDATVDVWHALIHNHESQSPVASAVRQEGETPISGSGASWHSAGPSEDAAVQGDGEGSMTKSVRSSVKESSHLVREFSLPRMAMANAHQQNTTHGGDAAASSWQIGMEDASALASGSPDPVASSDGEDDEEEEEDTSAGVASAARSTTPRGQRAFTWDRGASSVSVESPRAQSPSSSRRPHIHRRTLHRSSASFSTGSRTHAKRGSRASHGSWWASWIPFSGGSAIEEESGAPSTKGLSGEDTFEIFSVEDMTFTRLRDAAGLDPAMVAAILDPYLLSKRLLDAHFSQAASTSFFCRSRDEGLIVKTIEASEVEALVRLLPAYVQHLDANPDSFLCRYYGCFGLQLPGSEVVYFLLMGNVFPCVRAGAGTRRYDLKGSTVGRWTKAPPERSSDFAMAREHPDECGVPEEGPFSLPTLRAMRAAALRGGSDPRRRIVFRDSEFRSNFPNGLPLPEETREEVVDQLRRDSTLLATQGLMDYSLLVEVIPVIPSGGEGSQDAGSRGDGVIPPPPTMHMPLSLSRSVSVPTAPLTPTAPGWLADADATRSSCVGPASSVDASSGWLWEDEGPLTLPKARCVERWVQSLLRAERGVPSSASSENSMPEACAAELKRLDSYDREHQYMACHVPARVSQWSTHSFQLAPTAGAPQVAVQLGLLDLLQQYDRSKKLERGFKRFLRGGRQIDISALEPQKYAVRFVGFIDAIVHGRSLAQEAKEHAQLSRMSHHDLTRFKVPPPRPKDRSRDDAREP